jgi:transposase
MLCGVFPRPGVSGRRAWCRPAPLTIIPARQQFSARPWWDGPRARPRVWALCWGRPALPALGGTRRATAGEGGPIAAASAFAQLQRRFVAQLQRRYELIRPLLLCEERPTPPHAIRQRAQETGPHPETVRKCPRRFEQPGLVGLVPASGQPPARVSQTVREEIARLKGLDEGFHYRELVRIIWCSLGTRITDKTAKQLWQQRPAPRPGALPHVPSHGQPDRTAARLEGVQLYAQGWNQDSLRRFLQVSRPPVDRWIQRFEAEDLAGLVDRPRGPRAPRKVWCPLMVAMYHVQKAPPDAGEFRLWSLRANDTMAVRAVGRVMALTRQGSAEIPPPQGARGPRKPPPPHPYQAPAAHAFWCMDGRMMDFAFDGVNWWSVLSLDGSSRAILAGAVAPVAARWVTRMGLYTACLRYGAPQAVIADSGGAYTAPAVRAGLQR